MFAFEMILGIHSGHDSGAALVHKGEIIAAVNEERLTRDKLSFGFPRQSIHEVMRIAGITPKDVDEIALQRLSGPDPLTPNRLFWTQKAKLTGGRSLLDFTYISKGKLKAAYGLKSIIPNLLILSGLPRWTFTEGTALVGIRQIFGLKKPVNFIDHHTAHWASSFYTSGFDKALSVVVEGYDGEAGMRIGVVDNGEMTPIAASSSPHSPGFFYALCTRMMGFNFLLHGGKITGLAACGDPKKAYDIVSRLMWCEGMEVRLAPEVFDLELEWAGTLEMPEVFQPFSREDIAAAFQARLEEVMVEAVSQAMEKTGCTDIILSGGVAANVKMNQRIMSIPGVEAIVVHPGMSDCGLALGSAIHLDKQRHPTPNQPIKHVFLGTDIEEEHIEKSLRSHGFEFTKEIDIAKSVAKILQQGEVVVRVTGRMEYGPRALGHRSILCHCQDSSINDRLNKRLRRTEFMPFAPAVLASEAHKCFKGYESAEYTAEFMTITFDCTEWMAETCPAVVHVDTTARPQFVTPESNPDFHAILKNYHEATGVPALINTSFNMHNEPIPATLEDSIRVFKKSKLDFLAIGNYIATNSSTTD